MTRHQFGLLPGELPTPPRPPDPADSLDDLAAALYRWFTPGDLSALAAACTVAKDLGGGSHTVPLGPAGHRLARAQQTMAAEHGPWASLTAALIDASAVAAAKRMIPVDPAPRMATTSLPFSVYLSNDPDAEPVEVIVDEADGPRRTTVVPPNVAWRWPDGETPGKALVFLGAVEPAAEVERR